MQADAKGKLKISLKLPSSIKGLILINFSHINNSHTSELILKYV